MTERGRHRLVGAVILVALASIFLPMLFDGAGIERREVPTMPDEPVSASPPPDLEPGEGEDWAFLEEIERRRTDGRIVDGRPAHRVPSSNDAPAAGADGAEEDDDGESANGAAVAAAPPADAPPPAEAGAAIEARPASDEVVGGADAAGVPDAWSVQLATFAEMDNARRLRTRLAADGYDAYLLEGDDPERPLHRVAVGPRVSRAAARRLRTELAERYALEGLVVRFVLTDPRDG